MEFSFDDSFDFTIDIVKNKLQRLMPLLEPADCYCEASRLFANTQFDFGRYAAVTVTSIRKKPDDEFIEVKFIANHHPDDEYVWYFKGEKHE